MLTLSQLSHHFSLSFSFFLSHAEENILEISLRKKSQSALSCPLSLSCMSTICLRRCLLCAVCLLSHSKAHCSCGIFLVFYPFFFFCKRKAFCFTSFKKRKRSLRKTVFFLVLFLIETGWSKRQLPLDVPFSGECGKVRIHAAELVVAFVRSA